ncbi:uncharacterized protein Z518_01496 [Rhinocladiella mackenziei CBS 650.93]|uniref:F-box domain-containing protein n=1 Tax=Rhinocladiella mackenziei CBS 650.93 TaxID=1442369 RepID=A0A0D2IWN9_9EURO|nr:uncharacterized protein Z518_01496 [Rhinocladiella mackenziei CBS 650.93]KIX10414.1 hypothetical protein Z518_01496 [Rhinocladiella mackenziei CBS 650.93]
MADPTTSQAPPNPNPILTPTPVPHFFSLPKELSDQILSHLTYNDLLPFRLTCHFASALVPFSELKLLRLRLKTALLADERADYEQKQMKFHNFERWARAFPHEYRTWDSGDAISNIHANFITKATHLNCYACLRKLPRECFTETQAMGSRSLGHKDGRRRFCRSCGVSKGIWEKGSTVKDARCTWIICRGCDKMRKCDPDPALKSDGVCSAACLEKVRMTTMNGSCSLQKNGGSAEPHGSKRLEIRAATAAVMSGVVNGAGILEDATPSTRANRCLRCWAINHTERAADGLMGLNLCGKCEALVDHEGFKVKE